MQFNQSIIQSIDVFGAKKASLLCLALEGGREGGREGGGGGERERGRDRGCHMLDREEGEKVDWGGGGG